MLQIKALFYEIGGRTLLSNLSLQINAGDKMALIGPNGAGKTTLLRIITGELDDYQGNILKPRQYRIGYLPQEEVPLSGKNALETVMKGAEEIQDIHRQLKDVHLQWSKGDGDNTSLRDRADQLEKKMQSLDGYTLENRSEKILSGLGFSREAMNRDLSEFSGGWTMRVYLARLLIQKPDLLLLDEPTNHLDLESLEWLEKFLRFFRGAVMLVSHDRFFINRISRGIFELDQGSLRFYPGNYQFYEAQIEKSKELSIKKWKEYEREKQKLEGFVDRFRYKASKASQAQERLKQLNRLEKIEPVHGKHDLNFSIGVEKKSFNDVLDIRDLGFSYDQIPVFHRLNLKIYRGEKVALIGPNGTGKTTLTRLITGQLQGQKGKINLGENVVTGYYAQHQADSLNFDATVFEEIGSNVSSRRYPEIRNILGIFGFTGDDVHKSVRVLSGGEKARVSLAKTLMSSANFLIMDEPLNHLDREARQALELALTAYQGTLILISHDRYFLDKIVGRVVEIRKGRLETFDGNYSYYLEKRESLDDETAGSGRLSSGETTRREKKRLEARQRQEISGERNQLARRIEEYERRIDEMEKQKTDIEKIMSDPATYDDKERVIQLQIELGNINRDLPDLYSKWEQAGISLAELLDRIKTASR